MAEKSAEDWCKALVNVEGVQQVVVIDSTKAGVLYTTADAALTSSMAQIASQLVDRCSEILQSPLNFMKIMAGKSTYLLTFNGDLIMICLTDSSAESLQAFAT